MSQFSEVKSSTAGEEAGQFTEIVQQKYGEPQDVLKLVTRPVSELIVGDEDLLIEVRKRPIHPGDVHILRGASNGGVSAPIDAKQGRVPGFEGVGLVLKVGANVGASSQIKTGQRVIFFHGSARAWSTHTVVPASSVIALPDTITDEVAAQIFINSITALEILRTGHNSLPADAGITPYVLITAAGSSVNRLVTGIAIELGVKPILLVRSEEGATKLRAKTHNVPVISTAGKTWKDEVAKVLNGKPLYCAFDAVGGAFLNDVASVLSDGATIVNFGWQADGAPDMSNFAPRGLAIKGVSIGRWAIYNDEAQRAKHIETALNLAATSPELFEVDAQYPLSEFQAAINHVFRSGKSGVVLLNS